MTEKKEDGKTMLIGQERWRGERSTYPMIYHRAPLVWSAPINERRTGGFLPFA